MYIKFNDDKYLQTECRTKCVYASSLNTGTSSHISLDFLKILFKSQASLKFYAMA